MGRNCVTIPKRQWLCNWILSMDRYFDPTRYIGGNYSSTLALKLIRVITKRATDNFSCKLNEATFCFCEVLIGLAHTVQSLIIGTGVSTKTLCVYVMRFTKWVDCCNVPVSSCSLRLEQLCREVRCEHQESVVYPQVTRLSTITINPNRQNSTISW